MDLVEVLRSVHVLKSLSVGQLRRLQDLLTEVTFKDGEYVVQQGDQPENFYIIAEGRVRITTGQMTIMELGQGQYFGERGLINNEPRAANVIAMGEHKLKLLYISKATYEEVLREQ